MRREGRWYVWFVRFGVAASGGVGGGAAVLSGAARGVERLRGTSLGISLGMCDWLAESEEAEEGCTAVMSVVEVMCLIVRAFVQSCIWQKEL
jgi:hypothetical protein